MATQAEQNANTRAVIARLKSLSNKTKAAATTNKTGGESSSKTREQISTVQTKAGSVGLGAATIAAQQALSEKYGIPTFDTKGNISTVPQTRPVDKSINVGTGRFTRETFEKSVEALIQKEVEPLVQDLDIFDVFVLKPITNFFNSLFNDQDISELNPTQQNEVRKLDEEIAILQAELDKINSRPVPPPRSKGFFNGQEIFSTQDTERAQAKIREDANVVIQKMNILKSERDELIKKFVTVNRVEIEINNRLEKSEALVRVDGMSQELKTEIDKLVTENREFINRITVGNIPVAQGLLDRFVKVNFELFQRLKEDITLVQKEVKEDVNFLAQTFGQVQSFGEGIFNGFSEALNPPQQTTDEIALKTLRSTLKAQVIIAQEQRAN